MKDIIRKVGNHRLKSVSGYKASKLAEGTEIIVRRVWHNKNYEVVREEYYRTVTKMHKTAAGPELAIHSEPNAEWPSIPAWQLGWLWILEDLRMSFWLEIDERCEDWRENNVQGAISD